MSTSSGADAAVAADGRHLAVPDRPVGTGVLLLAGSSGRVERERAELLAARGARVLSLRWFGGPGQRPAPHEVPIETFTDALGELSGACGRLAIVGTSFGAEAALVTAAHDPRVDAVVAVAPTPVVWGGYAEGRWSSHWTLGGRPLPHVPFLADWQPDGDPPAYRSLYERSLAAHDDPAAAIAVCAGTSEHRVEARRPAGRRQTSLREPPRGCRASATRASRRWGHRVVLPGEPVVEGGQRMRRGGSPQADAALGERAWPHIIGALRLTPDAQDSASNQDSEGSR